MDASFDRFQGTPEYIVSDPLRHAVNVALALERPLLLRGEPGTGKTLLAENAAKVVKAAVAAMPTERSCACASALQYAILTDRAAIPQAAKEKLGLLLGKYL